ncbi:MAG: CCA tRNA nucleotidyltransferase [Parcubacteria group bacterium]|nr:CCA tRNA nucleotidyltransferase [Parcubacteria group bacterium]MCR4342437.1 CCA tRNA nucleotidyltransferase [Patescibacteria group bacterium]
MPKKTNFNIPKEVSYVTETLQKAGFEAYLVGGCVRDLLRGEKPKDWDVTTNATPEQIVSLFPKTFYENKFGTVSVVNESATADEDETLRNVEITPYRMEAKYSDKRHPDSVSFTNNIEDDLKRRDFTINAMALEAVSGKIIDLFDGQKDLKNKLIKAVGGPVDRFSEDALRMMRAVRFATELGFNIEDNTLEAIKRLASSTSSVMDKIAKERIRDEFIKIIMSKNPDKGMDILRETGLLKFVMPEIEEGFNVEQNKDHIYDVWTHSIKALKHSADKDFPLNIRLAALLHDVGKPKSRRRDEKKKDFTFYGHDVIGGKMSVKILARLKFPKKDIDTIAKLVRYHLFFSDVEQITLSAVRRIVRNVGPENVWDLMKVRFCDRIGMGRPKETPYRLRKYESMIDEAMRAPVTVGMLKIDGARIMEIAGEKPGPRIGFILYALLEEVLDDPTLNTKEYLEKEVIKLSKLPDAKLKKIGEKGKDTKESKEKKEIEEIRKKWWVK